jgi:outer membrane protein TolC
MDSRSGGRALAPVLVATTLWTGCAARGGEYEPARVATLDAPGPTGDAPASGEDAALTAPVLDRASYVRAVLRRNPSVEAARAGWRAAVAREKQAGTLADPTIGVELAPLSLGSGSARLGYVVEVSQRLPWPGKRSLEASAARAEADAQAADYEAARLDLALAAALLFDDYYVADRSLAINAHHVALMRAMHAAATAQVESGRGSAQDALQAEFELSHMEHDAIMLASQRDVTRAEMNELLHRAPELPLPPPPEQLEGGSDLGPADAARLQSEAGGRRPDIAALRRRATAQQLRADRAARDAFPDLTLSTSYNSMWDMPEHRWMVGLSFDVPLQSQGRRGAAEEAAAMREQLEAEAARMGDAARTAIVVALRRLEESEHVVTLYRERLVPLARSRIEAARAAFAASQGSFSAALDAEKTLRGAELDAELAGVDHDRRRAELDRAVGRVPGLEDGGEGR